MNKQRLVILIIAALGILATFMPWFVIPFIGSVSGMNINGWFVIVLYMIPVMLALMGDRTKSLDMKSLYGMIIPSLLCSAVAIWHVVNFFSKIEKIGGIAEQAVDFSASFTPSLGFGMYIVILAGIAIAASAFLLKSKNRD